MCTKHRNRTNHARWLQDIASVCACWKKKTSLVQLLDIVFNATFKAAIDKLASIHTQDNVDIYIKGKFFASERRISFTKWVGQAWEELSTKKDMIIWSFKKFGISVAIDRSEDSEINITDLEVYEVGETEDEATDAEATYADKAMDDVDPFEDFGLTTALILIFLPIIF